ncbi:MAG: hypothetical protein WCF23_13120 [Candidatus Nitrosopolaris sp.]
MLNQSENNQIFIQPACRGKPIDSTIRMYKAYCCHDGVFCPCCGMAWRTSPTDKRDKERLRQLQLRREEQDRIIRIIKGDKEVICQSTQVRIK